MSSPIQNVLQQIPPPMQGGLSSASLLTMAAAFLDKIHGPIATLGVILGVIWLGMQMWTWVINKNWRRKK